MTTNDQTTWSDEDEVEVTAVDISRLLGDCSILLGRGLEEDELCRLHGQLSELRVDAAILMAWEQKRIVMSLNKAGEVVFFPYSYVEGKPLPRPPEQRPMGRG